MEQHAQKMCAFVRELFPKNKIGDVKKIQQGYGSSVFVVQLKDRNPVIARISALRDFDKAYRIASFLHHEKIPTPMVYGVKAFDDFGIGIMEYMEGVTMLSLFHEGTEEIKNTILFQSGALLKKVHTLSIPEYWQHRKYTVVTNDDFLKWQRTRIDDNLGYLRTSVYAEYLHYVEKQYETLLHALSPKNAFSLSPLHWDYHLENILGTKEGKIVALIDFDNAVRGHNLADIGRFIYLLFLHNKSHINPLETSLSPFFQGYDLSMSSDEKRIIFGYFILTLVELLRIFSADSSLEQLVKKHGDLLHLCSEGKMYEKFL